MSIDYGTVFENNSLSGKQRAFIEVQNRCPLCNHQLEIKVVSHVDAVTLREEALCPSCEVPARVRDHKLQ